MGGGEEWKIFLGGRGRILNYFTPPLNFEFWWGGGGCRIFEFFSPAAPNF